MEFFNKLGDLANKAGKKTESLTKEAKIKMKMSDNKSKIEDIYREIGKEMYQKHVKGEEVGREDFAEYLVKIDDLSKEIEDYQNEIRKLRNKRMCANCDAEIDLNVKFCPHCGAEQPVIEEDETMEAEIVEDENKETENAEKVEETEEVKEEDIEEDIEEKVETEDSEPSE